MQAEQDALSLSARSFSNDFSRQHSQFLSGSSLGDQYVDIYSRNPDHNAYMLFGYNEHSDSRVDYAPLTLNELPASTGIYSAQYSHPAQQFTENSLFQATNYMHPMSHSFSDNGEINNASTNDNRSDLALSYEHWSSEHTSNGFPSHSHENVCRAFSHPQNNVQVNSFESSDNNMVRLTASNYSEQAPPDTSPHTRVSHVTPPRQTSGQMGKDPNPRVANRGSQGKPSETDQARERRARKVRGPTRKDKDHAELHSFRIAKRKLSRKPALERQQYPGSKTIAACSLWLSQNSGKILSEHEMSCLSILFGSSIEPIRKWFRRNVTVPVEDEDTGYQTMRDSERKRYPGCGTIAACSLWLSQNSGKILSEHEMSCLSILFGSSIEPIRKWFRRNMTVPVGDEDTGYQTMGDSENDITSLYQGNRGCKRRATSIGVRAVTSIQVARNEARPYACTSRCSKCFKDKASWERHEEKNRVQRLWVCSLQGCRNKEPKKRVWLNRKEHYINHVSNHHPGLDTTPRDIDDCCIEMKSNFDKHCIFRFCNQIFHSWKERINHIGDHLRRPWHMSDWRDMDEDEKDTDATASEDESGDSETDDLSSEDDSDDTEGGARGLGPSDSGHDQGTDRLGGHPGSSAQGPGSNSHQSRHRGDASTRPSKYDCTSYGSPTDSSVSGMSRGEPFPTSGIRLSVPSQARPILNARDQAVFYLSQPRHEPMEIHPLRILGRGSSAIVDEVKMKGYEVTFARKRILSCTQVQQRSLHRELIIMARLRHAHVIRLVASYQQANSINYIIRPVADCNLLQYMTARRFGSDHRSKMQGWFRCLASGLQYIHNSGVRHRDIKPSNMLLRDGRILYTDFGSSNIIHDDSSESDSADFTERYAAPEVFRGHRGRAADVFALGCVYLEMVAFLLQDSLRDGREGTYQSSIIFPYAREQHMESTWSTDTGMVASMAPSGSDILTVQTYCRAMMDPRPEQRPTATEIARQIPGHVCCEEVVDVMTGSKPASGSGLRSSSTASDRTLTSHLGGGEVIPMTALLALTSYTPWRGFRTSLEDILEDLLRTENNELAWKATWQRVMKKPGGEKNEIKEAVISERTKRSQSTHCDETADVPQALPLLVYGSDNGTVSDSSCSTVSGSTMQFGGPSQGLEAMTYSLPSNADHKYTMKHFLEERDPWQGFLMSNKPRTRARRAHLTRLLEDVRAVGVD